MICTFISQAQQISLHMQESEMFMHCGTSVTWTVLSKSTVISPYLSYSLACPRINDGGSAITTTIVRITTIT